MNFDGTLQTDKPDDKPGRKSPKLVDDDVLATMKDRFEIATKHTADSHADGLDDLRFLKGDQWPERQRRQRESEGRPVLTVNKLPTFLQQVTNDQRMNKVSIKISMVSESAKNPVAEIVQGMIRHIEYDSGADTAYDTAKMSAAAIGFGYFRFVTEYESFDSFNQVIKIKRIRNSFSVYFDPASTEVDGSDAEWVILTGKMKKKEFRVRFGDKALNTCGQFESVRTGDPVNKDWIGDDEVRIAEYYFKYFEPVTLYLLPDGRTVEKLMEGEVAIRQRNSFKTRILHYLCTAFDVIEKTEILAPAIPVFPVYGSEIDVDGEIYRAGVIRNAKDPAMMYNFWMTSATEEIAMRPKTPYIGAKGQFRGEETRWRQANNRSFAYLEYEPVTVDNQLAPPPQRQQPADVPSGYLTMAMHASDNIKATTGLFDSSLGAQSSVRSGKQEMALQRQGNMANYHFTDNFDKTLKFAGKVLVEMIPKYYDSERMVTVRGEDGLASAATINKYDEAAQKWVNDIRAVKFEAAVSVGPSYATMRAEASDAMTQFGQSWPKLMDIAGDKVVQAMNWPGADAIAERIKKTIPQELLGPEDGNEEPPIPPKVQQELEQLRAENEELQKEADANHAKITAEQIRKEAAIEAAQITAESRRDIEEIRGYVKLLAESLQPPEVIESEVRESASVVTPRSAADPQKTPQQPAQ